ncbi:hypothetical protein GCM10017559_47410 [Streptosporangium longisporum]|uniref:Uncharacterized protein n=2 Tax=Streptosporangium longisporum TaxID=46187 RepID=A0ABN3Y5D8_9ACTN
MWASKGNTEVFEQVVTFDVSRGDSCGRITFEAYKPADRFGALPVSGPWTSNHAEVGNKEVGIPPW